MSQVGQQATKLGVSEASIETTAKGTQHRLKNEGLVFDASPQSAVKPDGPSDADRHTATLLGGVIDRWIPTALLPACASLDSSLTFPPYFHLSLQFLRFEFQARS